MWRRISSKICRQKLANVYPDESAKVKWEAEAGGATLHIDPQILLPALVELFANAFRHERAEGLFRSPRAQKRGDFRFTLSEPKTNFNIRLENWGREPLRTLGQGHYGLGLHRTR